ncbi:hypothetical protein PMIN06_012183 [Paraphaeosphaeria minitans]
MPEFDLADTDGEVIRHLSTSYDMQHAHDALQYLRSEVPAKATSLQYACHLRHRKRCRELDSDFTPGCECLFGSNPVAFSCPVPIHHGILNPNMSIAYNINNLATCRVR